jgi:two-component system, cell cycle response regulator
VLPLLHHGRVLGTLILGARRRHAFGDTVRPTLEVLASHLAVSLSNARMVHKLETMATTDGMTGLLNKRAMLRRGVAEDRRRAPLRPQALGARGRHRLLQEGERHPRPRRRRRRHQGPRRRARAPEAHTDVVARFGGEEFVVLCEQTDEAGALQLGERIREELGKTTFTRRTAR